MDKAYSINISIGGFDLNIEGLSRTEKRALFNTYKGFVSDKKKSHPVRIIAKNSLPALPLRIKSFSLSNNWRIYKYKKNYCFELRNLEEGNLYVTNLAVFAPDFTSGQVYISRQADDFKYLPLSFPIDQLLLIHLLALNQGVLAHACGIIHKGDGFLFLGPSGAGKSTIGRLFSQHKNVTILNDDKVIIRKENSEFLIYGTPWHGTLPLCCPQKARLKKIFLLKKAKNNSVRTLPLSESARSLSSLCLLPYGEKKFMRRALSTITELVTKDIFSELSFLPDKHVINLIEDTT